jgi:hypothetical protein
MFEIIVISWVLLTWLQMLRYIDVFCCQLMFSEGVWIDAMHTLDLGVANTLAASVCALLAHANTHMLWNAAVKHIFPLYSHTYVDKFAAKVIMDFIADRSIFSGSTRLKRLEQAHAVYLSWCKRHKVKAKCCSFAELDNIPSWQFPTFSMLNLKAAESRMLTCWLAEFCSVPKRCVTNWDKLQTYYR